MAQDWIAETLGSLPDYYVQDSGADDLAANASIPTESAADDSLITTMGLNAGPSGQSFRLDAAPNLPDGWLPGFVKALDKGIADFGANVSATVDTYAGDLGGVEKTAAESASRHGSKQQTAFEQNFATRKKIDDSSLWAGIKNVVGATIDEPAGAAHMAVSQLPNMAAVLGPAVAGAKTGAMAMSVFGPGGSAVGAVVGAVGGMFIGTAAIETGAIAQEKARDADGFTQADADLTKEQGRIKAGFMTLFDAGTFGLQRWMAGAPGRAVYKSVEKALADKGFDITKEGAGKLLAQNDELLKVATAAAVEGLRGSTTTGKLVGRGASRAGLEVVGEGVGEYAGSAAAGLDTSFSDAVLEAMMSGPMSALELRIANDQANAKQRLSALEGLGTAPNGAAPDTSALESAINAAAGGQQQAPQSPGANPASPADQPAPSVVIQPGAVGRIPAMDDGSQYQFLRPMGESPTGKGPQGLFRNLQTGEEIVALYSTFDGPKASPVQFDNTGLPDATEADMRTMSGSAAPSAQSSPVAPETALQGGGNALRPLYELQSDAANNPGRAETSALLGELRLRLQRPDYSNPETRAAARLQDQLEQRLAGFDQPYRDAAQIAQDTVAKDDAAALEARRRAETDAAYQQRQAQVERLRAEQERMARNQRANQQATEQTAISQTQEVPANSAMADAFRRAQQEASTAQVDQPAPTAVVPPAEQMPSIGDAVGGVTESPAGGEQATGPTGAELEARRQRGRDAARRNRVVRDGDSLITAIAKLGGIHADDLGGEFDPADYAGWRHGIRRAVHRGQNALSLDGMREALEGEGFQYETTSDLLEAMALENSGTKQYTAAGMEAAFNAAYDEEMAARQARDEAQPPADKAQTVDAAAVLQAARDTIGMERVAEIEDEVGGRLDASGYVVDDSTFNEAFYSAVQDEINAYRTDQVGAENRRAGNAAQQDGGDFTLDTQTEQQARADADARAAESRAAAEQERRAAIDDQRGGFVLTGSDRAVDQAEARGQRNLFDDPSLDQSPYLDADIPFGEDAQVRNDNNLRDDEFPFSYATDMADQSRWLDARARAQGFANIDAMLQEDPAAFIALANQWREANPYGLATSTVADVEQELIDEIGGFRLREAKKSGLIKVVQSAELPMQMRRALGSDIDNAAAFWDGTSMWLIADNIAPGEAVGKMLHEAKHAGTDIWGELDDVQDAFDVLLDANDPTAVAANARASADPATEGNPTLLRDERLAYFVEEAKARLDANHPTGLSERARLLYRQIIAAIKAYVRTSPFMDGMRRKFIDFKLTDEYAVALAHQALRAAEKRAAEQASTDANGVSVDESGGITTLQSESGSVSVPVRFSLARHENFAQALRTKLNQLGKTSPKAVNQTIADAEQVRALAESLDSLNEVVAAFKREFGDDAIDTFFRQGYSSTPKQNNVDPMYKWSMEATAVCLRSYRLGSYTKAINEYIKARPHLQHLKAKHTFIDAMINVLQAHDETVQCAYCYVGSKRQIGATKAQEVLDAFDVIGDVAPADIPAVLRRVTLDNVEVMGANRAAQERNLSTLKANIKQAAGYGLGREFWEEVHLYYMDTRDDAKISMKARIDAIPNIPKKDKVRFLAKVTNLMANAKAPNGTSSYTGQLRHHNAVKDIATLSELSSGLRFFSSTDLTPEFIVDHVQMLYDMHYNHLKSGMPQRAHRYTKELKTVLVDGASGMKVNVSLSARGVRDGELLPDTGQTADWDEARKLVEQYPDVGTILVATKDDVLQAAMDDPFIHYVIPYHSSGKPKDLERGYAWKDFGSEAEAFEEGFDYQDIPKHLRDKVVFVASVVREKEGRAPAVSTFSSYLTYPQLEAKLKLAANKPGVRIVYSPHITIGSYVDFETGTDLVTAKERYLALAEQLHIAPKWKYNKQTGGDAAAGKTSWLFDHPNYMKVVIDYARIDTPFRSIDATKIDHEAMTDLTRGWIERHGYEGDSEANPEILKRVAEFIEDNQDASGATELWQRAYDYRARILDEKMGQAAPAVSLDSLQLRRSMRTDARFSYAGPRAKTANQSAMSEAVAMQKRGASPAEIRRKTGWFLGMDGKWRFEISDKDMRINANAPAQAGKDGVPPHWRLGDLIDHPRLFEAYPELRDVKVETNPGAGRVGSYNPATNTITATKAGRREVLAHEIQHVIQRIEGFATGGTPGIRYEAPDTSISAIGGDIWDTFVRGNNDIVEWFADAGDTFTIPSKDALAQGRVTLDNLELLRDVAAETGDDAAYGLIDRYIEQGGTLGAYDQNQYQRLAGEIEARDTAHRIDLDEMERQGIDPYESQGIPAEDAIVMFGDGVAQSSGVKKAGATPGQGKTGIPGAITTGNRGTFDGNNPDIRFSHKAWHGSPHDFDAFKLQHIGSGEGAQAYGWGLYFAGRKEVAEFYREQLGAKAMQRGRIYEVDLAPNQDDYLDWDKPLSEQSEKVQAAARKVWRRIYDEPFDASVTGARLYDDLTEVQLSQEGASKMLLRQGIPGIRYLDGSSRSKGDGNHNYVIFDDSLVKVEARYSKASTAGATKDKIADAEREWREKGTGSKYFKKWFGDSVVSNYGEPKIVYHWTDSEFSVFDTEGSQGAHFGTAKAASDRAGGMDRIEYDVEKDDDGYWVYADSGPMAREGQGPFRTKREAVDFVKNQPKRIEPMAVYLSIQNAVRMPDLGVWSFDGIKTQLVNQGILSMSESGAIHDDWNKSDAQGWAALRKAMAKHGYDGIVYTNEQEDIGSDSYVVLSPTQIKSATGNRGTFDGNNPDIRFSRTNNAADRAIQAVGRAVRRPVEPVLNLMDEKLKKLKLVDTTPQAAKDMIRKYRADITKAMQSAENVATEGKVLSEAEKEMLSDVIEKSLATGVTPPAHVQRLATAISAAMDRQTNDLLALGMITDESADRWRDIYLPRFYQKHLSKKLEAEALRVGTVRAGIKGNHLKGRGMWEAVPKSEASTWTTLGWEIRGDVPKAQSRAAARKLDADAATRDAYEKEDWVYVWRDYTPGERAKMGEIRDAIFRYAAGYMETQKDIALGRLFERISLDPDLAVSDEADAGDGWVQLAQTKISNTPGVKRYGKLAGMWVHPDVAEQMEYLAEGNGEMMRTYRRWMAAWKENMTAMNPASHVNNVMSNVFSAHFAGVSPWHIGKYRRGLSEYFRKGPMYQEAVDNGLIGTEFLQAEMQDLFASYDLPGGWQTAQAGLLDKIGNLASKVAPWRVYRENMRKAYQAEDQMFKMIIYMDQRDQGASIDEAIRYTERFVFNYADLPKNVRLLRDTALPFVSYTYKAIGMMAYTAANNPTRLIGPAAMLSGINMLSYMMLFGAGADDQEDKERSVLPRWMQGNTALGGPKNVRLPIGTDGEATFLDIYRWVPLGDIFDMQNQSGGIAWPAPFMPSNPLLTIGFGVFHGRDSWFGSDVLEPWQRDLDGNPNSDGYKRLAAWTLQQVLPAAPIVPGSYRFNQIMEGIANETGTQIGPYTGTKKGGDPYSLSDALMHTVGIKVRNVDFEDEREKRMNSLQWEARNAKREASKANRNYSKGGISDGQREAILRRMEERMREIRERADALQ